MVNSLKDIRASEDLQEILSLWDCWSHAFLSLQGRHSHKKDFRSLGISGAFSLILFLFVERSRATSRGLVSHFWPMGHRLGTPILDANESIKYFCQDGKAWPLRIQHRPLSGSKPSSSHRCTCNCSTPLCRYKASLSVAVLAYRCYRYRPNTHIPSRKQTFYLLVLCYRV